MDHFAFEDLEVWKKEIQFANLVIDAIESLESSRKHFRRVDRLEAAVASNATNIAEGRRKFSKKEFVQSLYIARASLFETMTLVEIFKEKSGLPTVNMSL